MKTLRTLVLTAIASGLVTSPALADDGLFHLDTSVNGVRTSASYTSVEAAFDALKGANLQTVNPAYTGTQAALVSIDYRGVVLSASYLAAGGSTLTLNVPSIGLSQTFNGGSRDATQQQLRDYFKQNGDNVLGKLSRSLAKNSAVDPIAGNPNSLMSQVVGSDFAAGFLDTLSTPDHGPGPNLGLVAPGYQRLREGGVTSSAVVLPLAWTVRSDDDPRRQFTVRAPLAQTDTDGSRSYSVGLGASLGLPVTSRWTLTPSIDYAAAGSRDLGSLAGLAAGSVTSSYVVPFGAFDLAIGDMVGYYKAVRVKSGAYGYDPGIANTVLRNGLVVSQPVMLGAYNAGFQYSLVDTQFFGDALYARHYDEAGVSVGTDSRVAASRGDLRAGASYLFAPKIKGFSVSLRMRF